MRYGVFVHDPDGDMGYGVILGAFQTVEAADRKAEQVRRAGPVECIVVPLLRGSHSAREVTRHVQ